MAMKVVRQARLELSGGSTPDQLRPPEVESPASPRNSSFASPSRPAVSHRKGRGVRAWGAMGGGVTV